MSGRNIGGPILVVDDISLSFGGVRALQNVSFDVHEHEIRAIIGPNGAGKTTLFNLITGHLKPDSGQVMFKGREVTGIPPHDLCRLGMGRSFQRTNIFPKLTVYQNVQAICSCNRRWMKKGRGRLYARMSPRRRPSVESIATQRTQLLPRCFCTSSTRGSAPSGRGSSTAS